MENNGRGEGRQSLLSGGPVKTLGAFAVGLLIGLVVLGWYVFPVQWTNAGPGDLAGGYREDYLAMVAESFARNGNAELARMRLRTFDAAAIHQAVEALNKRGLVVEAQQVRALSGLLPGAPVAAVATQTTAPAVRVTPGALPALPSIPGTQPGSPLLSRLGLIAVVCVGTALFVIGAPMFVVWLTRRRSRLPLPERTPGPAEVKPAAAAPVRATPRDRASVMRPGPGWEIREVELGESVATEYVPGEVRYRESFQIKNAKDETVGECGVRIAETLSIPDRRYPPAFDVWLYDRLDDRTVKAVILTDQAYSERAQRQQLAGKGQPIQPVTGKILSLETANLHLEAELVDFEYGQPTDPAVQSFFNRFVVQLTPTQREETAQEDEEPPEVLRET